MVYLTSGHELPPTHVLSAGLRHPVAPLIRREDIHRLSQLGVLRHVTTDGPAPLGYGPWRLAEDAQGVHYVREPAGTEEEIAAAIAAQEEAALVARRAGMRCTPIQGELALIRYGQQVGADVIGAYDAWRTAPERTREERAWIERTQWWNRLDPHVLSGAAAVGITEEAMLDALFEMAQTL